MGTPTTLDPPSVPPAPSHRRWGNRPHLPLRFSRLVGVLTGIALAVVAAGLVLWVTHRGGADAAAAKVPVDWRRPVVSADDLVQRSGVKITVVAVTGDGGLVDLRFKVIDPERANALHDPRTPPAVVDEESGLVVHELFMDHSHSGPYKAGVTYYLVFNNPGNWLRHGSTVSVLLGDAQVRHVPVT
jgi:hypothetical protein